MAEESSETSEVKEQDAAQCIYCCAQLPVEAVRCSSCGAFQNWRRHLSLSGNVLALLVALVSVSALTLPVFIDSLRGGRSILSFDHSFTNDEFAYFHFRNKGGAPGLIQSIEFIVGSYGAVFEPNQLGVDSDERLLRSNTGGVVRISPTRLMANGFLIEMASDEREALLDDFQQWILHVDYEDGFQNVIRGNPWPDYEIPRGGFQAKVTDTNVDQLEQLDRDVYVGLNRAQSLFRDLDIEHVRSIDYDDWYRPNDYKGILTVLEQYSRDLKDLERYLNIEIVQTYLETNVILEFVDRVFNDSSPHILVRLRNSDGSEKKQKIPVLYQEWRRFLRPILLNANQASQEWLAFFY